MLVWLTDNHVVIVPIGFLLAVSVVAAVYILFVPVNTFISWLCPYEKKELLVVLVLFSEEYGERENNNYGHYLIINQTWKYVWLVKVTMVTESKALHWLLYDHIGAIKPIHVTLCTDE